MAMNEPAFASRPLIPAALFLTALYAALAFTPLRAETVPLSIIAISVPLAAALIALSVIDLCTMRLPDAITLPLIVAGPLLAIALGWDGVMWRIGSAAAGFLFLFAVAQGYQAWRGRAGLGLGDAKLFAAAGAWLGLEGLPSVLVWASCTALLAVLLAIMIGRRVEASSRVPFGPFLAFGFWAIWLYGPIA
jgi:leader peptidase (prepilin peptidase) / N-methyltransferase